MGGLGRDRAAEIGRILLLVAVTVLLRFLFLDADPPGNLHAHFITDEGWWAHNARQRVLFGQWIMDDHNPPLYSAPVYTFLLWLVYEALGVGIQQTRLLSAFAGLATCVAVYAFVRREAGPRVALLSALLISVDYFVLTNNRAAFTESLQLAFATVGILAGLHALRRPAWAALSAACVIASILCKQNAVAAGAVILVLYGFQLFADRGRPAKRRPVWRAAGVFVVTSLVLTAGIVVWLVLPNWSGVASEYASDIKIGMAGHSKLWVLGRLAWFGYLTEVGVSRPVPVGFFIQEALPLLAVSVLALLRILELERRPLGPLEKCCWLWLGVTFAFVATQSYQPDRRFMLSAPPLAILLGLTADSWFAQGRPGDTGGARHGWRRWFAVWAVTGFATGLILRPLLMPWLIDAADRATLGTDAGVSNLTLLLAGWLISLVVASLLFLVLRRWRRPERLAVVIPLLVVATMVWDGVRIASAAGHMSFTMRDASRDIGRLAATLPPGRRIMVGTASDSFALESDLFAFLIRQWDECGMLMNLDGMERFHPALGIETFRDGVPLGGAADRFDRMGLPVLRTYVCWPGTSGRPRLRATLYVLDAGLFPAIRAGEEADASAQRSRTNSVAP